jgi:4'-phosphopantetheinyl transferase EntD
MISPFPDNVAFVAREAAPGDAEPPPPEEAALLADAGSPTRRRQFALGRACAREALRQLGGPGAAAIGRAQGRIPRWPTGFVGSISHSRQRAAAAAAHARDYLGLGVDLERARAPSPALLRRILRPAERAALAALSGDPLAAAFTALFAAKEALYKAVNPITGVYLGFQDAEVEFPPGTDWLGSGAAGSGGPLAWRLLKDSGPRFPGGFPGSGAWRRDGAWIVAAVWIGAATDHTD